MATVAKVIQCGSCKQMHWSHYPCAEAGYDDPVDGWILRPMGVAFHAWVSAQVGVEPVSVEQKKPVSLEQTEPVSLEQTVKGRHPLTTAERRRGGLNGVQTRKEVLSKTERSEYARRGAQEKWRRYREAKAQADADNSPATSD